MKHIICLSMTPLTAAAILFIYWCGGGNFERGSNLGGTVALIVMVSPMMSVLAYTVSNIIELESRHK